jgi:hypothetical protein
MRWTLPVKLKLFAVLLAVTAGSASAAEWLILLKDPRGPFILANMDSPAVAVGVIVGMLAVAAAVGTLLLHRDIPAVGWLVLGAVWVGLGLRSWPIDNRLMLLADDQIHGFYVRLLAELLLFGSATGIIGLLAVWLSSLLTPAATQASPGPEAKDKTARGADDEADDADISGWDGPLKADDRWFIFATQVVALVVLAIVLYLMLLGVGPVDGELPGQILRGQVVFALVAAFALGSFATHQFFSVRSPVRLLLGLAVTAVVCYGLSSILPAARRFAYQPTTRFGAMLPVDFLGMSLAATMAGYLISFRMVQLRRRHKREAADKE